MLDAGESEPQRARPVGVGRTGIRLAAALMALLVLASIGGFLAHEHAQTLEEAAALSERRAGRLAGELGDALAVAAAAVQRIEARLAQLPPGEPVAGLLSEVAAEQRPVLAALPQPLRLVALGVDGRPLAEAAAAPGQAETLPVADGWQVGLTRGAAGGRSVPVLRRAAPNPQGVAAFVVELDHAALIARLESSRTPDGGSAALFRIEAGGGTTLLARAPLDEAEIGQRVRGPLAAAVVRAPRGSFSAQTQLDQVRRIVAYQRLDGELAELVVAYGMATDPMLADWRALLPWSAGAALLLLGGIGAGARRLEKARQAQADQLQALQRSEDQFRALANNLPDVVVRYDREGHHLFTNPAVQQATGLPPQAFAGKTNAELGMPAAQVALWTACLQRVFASGQPERLEFDYPGPDGLRHWESLAVLEPRPPGAEPTALVISRDITERQSAQAELRQFKTTLDLTDDCVFMFEPDTLRFTYVNKGAAHQVGYSTDELRAMTPVDIKPDFDEAAFRALVEPLRKGGLSSLNFETRHRHKSGHDIPVDILLQHIAPEGEPPRFIAVVRDITERKQAEQALRRMNEELEQRVQERTAELEAAKNEAERANLAKSEFLSRMSHELRTPLNAILGFGQLLEIQPEAPARSSHVREILNAGRHLLTLIDEVLDLARVESGNLTVSPEPVAVLPLVQDCQTLLRLQAQARGIRLVDPSPLCAVHVRADRTRLKQVLLNLMSNGIKYNREGGSVSVACVACVNDSGEGSPAGMLRIRVHDTGAGLSAEQLSRLFVPFERLDAEDKRIPGTGIGLALSKRLVELMGGTIGVESAPGSGSTFWVELPLGVPHAEATRPAALAPTPAPALPATTQRELLCIEDNPANLRLLESIFERRSDIRLLTAMDPSLGLELARTHRPALILLDINLPDMDGYAVMQCLRENDATRRIPVLAISANAMPRDLERAKAAGFAAYLTKPLDVQALMARVDALLLNADGGPATS